MARVNWACLCKKVPTSTFYSNYIYADWSRSKYLYKLCKIRRTKTQAAKILTGLCGCAGCSGSLLLAKTKYFSACTCSVVWNLTLSSNIFNVCLTFWVKMSSDAFCNFFLIFSQKTAFEVSRKLSPFVQNAKGFFLIFPRKQPLTFHANCLLWRQFARNTKVAFLGKIRKRWSICHLLNLPWQCIGLIMSTLVK